MLMNVDRAREIFTAEGLDGVVLSNPGNVLYGADAISEFMLGRFEDFTSAVIFPVADMARPAMVVPEFDLPFHVENPSRIDDIQLYGNSWSSVGVFMGETLERSLDGEFRTKLKALRDQLRPNQKDSFFDALGQVLKDRDLTGRRIAFDDLRLAAVAVELGLVNRDDVRDATQIMRRVRMVKTADEISILKQGAKINAKALRAAIDAGSPGLPEDVLIRAYRLEMTRHDARYLGERGMMFGSGDGSSFSLPANRDHLLKPGDAIVLDCLGAYRGYHMDLARTGVVGDPTADQKHRHQAVISALEAVEAAIRPGVHTQDLRQLTRDTIAGCGLRGDLVSVTTHGLGIELFEFPEADGLINGFELEQGCVVNTEVFYRDPDLGSFHLEDSVHVTADGCVQLFPLNRDLVVFS